MNHLDLARTQIGTKEISGTKDNPEILKYFHEIGHSGKAIKDETAWCSAFINWVAKKSGLPYSGKLTARSWLHIGKHTDTPKKGDVVVFWRESPNSWKGHVGFYIRENATHIYVLGGNQNNQVCIKPYPKTQVLQYRSL